MLSRGRSFYLGLGMGSIVLSRAPHTIINLDTTKAVGRAVERLLKSLSRAEADLQDSVQVFTLCKLTVLHRVV